jgi:hypothetical protein
VIIYSLSWRRSPSGGGLKGEAGVDHLFLEISLELDGALVLFRIGRERLAAIVHKAHNVRAKQVEVTVIAGLQAFRNRLQI